MRNITKNQFRILLTLALITRVLGTAVTAFSESSSSDFNRTDYEQNVGGEWLAWAIVFFGLVAAIFAIVGLYRFRPWSRPLTVTVWLLSLFVLAFAGTITEPALATALSDCSSVLFGMVLALAYFSPAAEWFTKPATESNKTIAYCSRCGQPLRVTANGNPLRLRCPACKFEFDFVP